MEKERTPLQELETMDFEYKLKRYPNVPLDALQRTRFDDKTTAGLTNAITRWFGLHGIFATRIDSKGTFNKALMKFIPSRQRKGLPDLFAQAPGFPPIWVEVKCRETHDRLRPDQRETIKELRESGALVFIAEDFQGFYEWFAQNIKPNLKTKNKEEICQSTK